MDILNSSLIKNKEFNNNKSNQGLNSYEVSYGQGYLSQHSEELNEDTTVNIQQDCIQEELKEDEGTYSKNSDDLKNVNTDVNLISPKKQKQNFTAKKTQKRLDTLNLMSLVSISPQNELVIKNYNLRPLSIDRESPSKMFNFSQGIDSRFVSAARFKSDSSITQDGQSGQLGSFQQQQQQQNQNLTKNKAENVQKDNNLTVVHHNQDKISKESIGLVFKQMMGTDEPSKVSLNLSHMARGLCKIFDISCTEICFVDKEFISLLVGIEPASKQNVISYMDLGEIHISRCSFDKTSRIDKKSYAFGMLAKEYPNIKNTRAILFKNNGIYLPIISRWRNTYPTVIGCVILSKNLQIDEDKTSVLNSKVLKSRVNLEKDEVFKPNGIFKMGTGFLKEVINQISYFTDVCKMDLKQRQSYSLLNRITQLMAHFKFDGDIRKVLLNLRIQIPIIMGFEECGILVQDKNESEAFFTINPNVEYQKLNELKKLDLYFFNLHDCLTLDCFKSGQPVFTKNPRSYANYVEGFDNQTPVSFFFKKFFVRIFSQWG